MLGDRVVVAVVFLATVPDRDLAGIVLWIGAGCVVVGAIGWIATTVLVSGVNPEAGFGAGFAVGGGLGAVVRLIAFSDETGGSETVTVETNETANTDGPQPVDLFEASPDPLLYYTDSDGPAVRAVNPAFEERFGISTVSLAGEPLEQALMTSDGAAATAAAVQGEQFDESLVCETSEEERQFRVRVIPVAPARGYVVFTRPLEG
jgi:PAS domain-containing protein